VTHATAPVIEALYLDLLAAMQTALTSNPFVLGQRPTQADFGLFGSMFRHFSSDPTPVRILRERAPAVLEWVARVWNLQPLQFADSPQPESLSPGLDPLLAMVCADYLPALAANEVAHQQGGRLASWRCRGVAFSVPVNPYQLHCLQQLRWRYQALPDPEREQVNRWLRRCNAAQGATAAALLADARAMVSAATPAVRQQHRLPRAFGPGADGVASLSRQWR